MSGKAFELPFYDSKLKEWLVRCKVQPSDKNVEALAQLLGQELQNIVASVIRYLVIPYRHASRHTSRSSTTSTTSSTSAKKPKGRTIQSTDVLVAMQTVHGGKVPIPLLQGKTAMELVLPKSSFNRVVRELGAVMIDRLSNGKDNEKGKDNDNTIPRLRWGLEALAMIQREVEWYIRTKVDKARSQSKRYYNEKTYFHGIKARSRSRQKSRGRSKPKDYLPTSNVYRYLK